MVASAVASVDVALEPSEAFRVFTQEIDEWYVVDRGSVLDVTRTVAITLEPGVGGRLLDVYDAATGEGRELARVSAWEPGRRLGLAAADGTDVEVAFAAIPYGTRVRLEHRGLDRLPAAEAERTRRFGWTLVLRWYAGALASRPAARAATPTQLEGEES